MNATVIDKKKPIGIPKPGIYSKKRLSTLTALLKTLSIYDPEEDNKLVFPVPDGDPGKLQSKINQAAKSEAVQIRVRTRHDDQANVIYVYREE